MFVRCETKKDAEKIIIEIDKNFGFPIWGEGKKIAKTYAIPVEDINHKWYIPTVDLQYDHGKTKKEFVKVTLPEEVTMELITTKDYKDKMREKPDAIIVTKVELDQQETKMGFK